MKKYNDKEGRIICLEALINEVRTILCNIYAPYKEEPYFFQGINQIIDDYEGQVILARDFNQVMDGIIDKSKPRGGSSSREREAIHLLTDDLSLVDVWRLVNPSSRVYTFYSNCHKTYSRIDFASISKYLVDAVVGCEIGTIAISDHATVLQIDFNTDKSKKGSWRLNTMLLQNKMFSEELTKDLKFFFEVNIGLTDKVARIWEASKAYRPFQQ